MRVIPNLQECFQNTSDYCSTSKEYFFCKSSKINLPETMRASFGPTVCMLPIFQMGVTAANYNLTEILSNFQLAKKGCLFRTVGGKFSMQRARRAIMLSIDPLLDTCTPNRASISSIVGIESDGTYILVNHISLKITFIQQ